MILLKVCSAASLLGEGFMNQVTSTNEASLSLLSLTMKVAVNKGKKRIVYTISVPIINDLSAPKVARGGRGLLLPPKNPVALSLQRSLSQEKVKELKCFVLLLKVEKTENRIENVIFKKKYTVE